MVNGAVMFCDYEIRVVYKRIVTDQSEVAEEVHRLSLESLYEPIKAFGMFSHFYGNWKVESRCESREIRPGVVSIEVTTSFVQTKELPEGTCSDDWQLCLSLIDEEESKEQIGKVCPEVTGWSRKLNDLWCEIYD